MMRLKPLRPVRLPRRPLPVGPRRRSARGQAMVEYSIVTWVLVVALVIGATVRIIPGADQQRSLIEIFLDAYRAYYESYYFVLDLPFP